MLEVSTSIFFAKKFRYDLIKKKTIDRIFDVWTTFRDIPL